MKKVLLITEDDRIGQLIARFVNILLPDTVVMRDVDVRRVVAMASDEQPDLIILDSILKGLPSHDVARYLKWDVATRDIPVVCAGHPDSRHGSKLRGYVDAWVARPTPLWALSQAIETALQNGQPKAQVKMPTNWLRLTIRQNQRMAPTLS